jgi:uncharacterized SAM-binding protein YcdF (DUF218 family)
MLVHPSMFFVKKLISQFLLPTTASLALLIAGVVLLWLGRRLRLARVLITIGTGLFLLCSYLPVADTFLGSLEYRYPPLYPRAALEQAIKQAGATPKWIVVLGGGHALDQRFPANDQIGESALYRLVEAIRLQRELPGTRILLSGGVGGRIKHADILAQVARSLGVPQEDFVLDKTAWDTEQEAANLAGQIGKEPFFLVTSAFHLPRAAALFRRLGLRPIPVPAHHQTLNTPGIGLDELFPGPGAMRRMDAGVHEYLGLLWSRLRGKI